MAAKKRGLGRGLDALLGPSAGSDSVSGDETSKSTGSNDREGLQQIPIEWLQPGRFQPRRHFEPESLQELARSIETHGIMQPLVVKEVAAQKYELIAGERRWRAAQIAGLDRVPCLLRDASPENQLAMAIIENIQREDLNPLDEALAFARLIDEFSLTHQLVADAVGKSRAAVSNAIRLSKLGPTAAEFLAKGDLEMGHARALLTLEAEAQASLAREIVAKGLTVRQAEASVKRMLTTKPISHAEPSRDPDVALLEQRLGTYFGQTVKIKKRGQRKGELVITYNSLEELEGVLSKSGFTGSEPF